MINLKEWDKETTGQRLVTWNDNVISRWGETHTKDLPGLLTVIEGDLGYTKEAMMEALDHHYGGGFQDPFEADRRLTRIRKANRVAVCHCVIPTEGPCQACDPVV